MYTYMFTYVYICMVPEAYLVLISCMSLLSRVYIYIYIHIYVYVYIYIYIFIYVHAARGVRGFRQGERWGAGVEYHFQEFNEPYTSS